MKNAFRMTMIAAATAIIATPALAAPNINFSIQASPVFKPTMTFNYANGKYVWQQASIATGFSASADTQSNQLWWSGPLHVDSAKSAVTFTGSVPTSVKSWSLTDSIVFPVNFLGVYQQNFAEYCDQNGKTAVVEKNGLSILFYVRQSYITKPTANAPQELPGKNWATRIVSMPVKVVCGAKPGGTQPRPGGLVQEKGSFKVQSIDLSFGGAPTTKPNPATVCKQAKLTVTVKANQAGAVKFKLWTKIGAAPTQSKVIDAWAKHDGNGFFVASYQENVSVNRTTGVQAKAEEMINAIELSTPWKNVTLHCTGAGGGGLTNSPNANPDGLPQAPKQPKRVFDGPSGVTAGAKPTHAPAKPVILPAQIKTAPVIRPVQIKTAPAAQPQQRTPRHLGRLSFGVEREMKESGEN